MTKFTTNQAAADAFRAYVAAAEAAIEAFDEAGPAFDFGGLLKVDPVRDAHMAKLNAMKDDLHAAKLAHVAMMQRLYGTEA